MSEPVTTDLSVLKGWPKPKRGLASSAEVATALNLTVFQVTARLKGMEGRGFLARDQGKWFVTEAGAAERDNPSPSISGASKKMRTKDSTGVHSGPPDDTNVPRMRLTKFDWTPPEASVQEARVRLPQLKEQATQYKPGTREAMAIATEIEHCEGVIAAGRKGKWTSRIEHTNRGAHTIYIAPDRREYVHASAYETADLLIESRVNGLSPSRLRLYSTSAAARVAKKSNKEQQANAERETAKAQETRNARILSDESTGIYRDASTHSGKGASETKEAAIVEESKRVVPKANGRADKRTGARSTQREALPKRSTPKPTQAKGNPASKGGPRSRATTKKRR